MGKGSGVKQLLCKRRDLSLVLSTHAKVLKHHDVFYSPSTEGERVEMDEFWRPVAWSA